MHKEPKYLVELSARQLLEILEWQNSHILLQKKRKLKSNYLKRLKQNNLAEYLKDAYKLSNKSVLNLKNIKPIENETLRICQLENLPS